MDEFDDVCSENSGIKIRLLINRYRDFKHGWLESFHEPSKMVALFMKYMSKFMRCKNGISAHDSWILEIESCDWLSAWHMNKKSTYLRLQCDYMELFYDESKVSDYIREIMRVNCFCIKASTKAVAFDFDN